MRTTVTTMSSHKKDKVSNNYKSSMGASSSSAYSSGASTSGCYKKTTTVDPAQPGSSSSSKNSRDQDMGNSRCSSNGSSSIGNAFHMDYYNPMIREWSRTGNLKNYQMARDYSNRSRYDENPMDLSRKRQYK